MSPRFALPLRSVTFVLSSLLLASLLSGFSHAADLSEARRLFRTGNYEACAEAAVATIADGYHGEDWPVLKIESDLQLGRHAAALQTLEAALKDFRYSVRLRYVGQRVFLLNNLPDRAEVMSEEITECATRASYRYNDSANRVTLGRFFLDRGADPRRVLETFSDPVKANQPTLSDAFIAAGELALSKSDFALAAEEFQNALKRSPDDPDIHYGLARAFSSSDTEKANSHIEAALKINPRHAPTLLLLVDNKIDAESYDAAEKGIQQVLDINPVDPDASAYRAVLAHLNANEEAENEARQKALSTWAQNPNVDYLIGRKLSEKYRFKEGTAYQRRAIGFDKFFMPAQIQLSQDLLRLGEVEEGWQRAELVFDADAYNVVAHNLVRLQASMAKFATLQNDDFIVRMDAQEAAIYGDHVLQLLGRAKETLCDKYAVPINEPVTVEIFPQQQDFAIRTFGLPGGEGFLGVCFGRVITANSPASQGTTPSNLDSVLWHEFCHVVTLQKTRNRMPRWLSEGISVYEERQADISWGQTMNPLYRKIIAEGGLTPVSELSGAFLRPASALHLQFAYYESSLAVEYLVEKHGRTTLNQILTDLGIGMPINESLGRYAGSIELLNKEFEQFAQERAVALAPDASWDEVTLDATASEEALAAWVEQHPNSFAGLQRYAQKLIEDKRYDDAKLVIRRFIDLCPDYVGSQSGYALMAALSREEGDVEQETAMLEHLASRQSDATEVYLRLMELGKIKEDWNTVARNADRMLAVNPLLPAPHRYRSEAAEQQNDSQAAVQSYQALLTMDPADPALIHFRLAHHLYRLHQTEKAQRHLLMALEEAPRYRDAHRLLLEIVAANPSADSDGAQTEAAEQVDADQATPPGEPAAEATPQESAGGQERGEEKL